MVNMDLNKDSLKRKIRIFCAERNCTMSQVAKEIGISQPTLSSKLNGHTRFSANEIIGLAHLLGVTPNDLLLSDRGVE